MIGVAFFVVFLRPDGAASTETAFRSMGPSVSIPYPNVLSAQPDFGLEWWYFTGHLRDENNRYGFELTFFRVGVKNTKPVNRFSLRDVHIAHFAVTDIPGRRFFFSERSSRGAFDEAGARADRLHVWNGNWSALGDENRIRLNASEPDFGLDLTLTPARPPVFHGKEGYSQKGPGNPNASFYVSLTRVIAEGTLRIGDRSRRVEGTAWVDREVTTPVSRPDVRGWDWFAIQFDGGGELMLYRIYDDRGKISPYSAGTLVGPDGRITRLSATEFDLRPTSSWRSPASGIEYDVGWRLRVPGQNLHLAVRTELENQELLTERSTRNTYWEGACRVTGTARGEDVTGRAYLEMNRSGLPRTRK